MSKRVFDRLKRAGDVTTAAIGLSVGLPVLGLVALAVRWKLGSPVLFRQERPGLEGRTFTLVKFRTMRDATDAAGRPLSDEERLTAFGRLLRSTSLDELPELWNVLKGEMSLVGPRPLMPAYLPLYSAEQARRHEVRPGITGWAQVSGRNAVPWPERLAMDVWYVDHRSAWLDIRILALTVWKVVARHGVAEEGQATMTAFRGET